MAAKSREFVGIAEGIRKHELSTRGQIESLKGHMMELSGRKSSLNSTISCLEAAIAAAYEDTDEDGDPDYGRIEALEAQKSSVEDELSDVEADLDDTGSELESKENELEAVEEEKAQTLFEIQERARRTSQNISFSGGTIGAFAGTSMALQASLNTSLSALSQAAGILGGSVDGASGGSSRHSSSRGGGSKVGGSASPNPGDGSSSAVMAFTAGTSDAMGTVSASKYETSQDGHTPSAIPSFGNGSKSINTKPVQNFATEQGENGFASAAFASGEQVPSPLTTDAQYTTNQEEQDTARAFGSSDYDLAYLDANTADTDMLPMARDSKGNAVSAQEAAYHSPFSNQQDTSGAFISDDWKPGQVSRGTVLFQLGGKDGTKSSYFTDVATVRSCVDPKTGWVDMTRLKERLQISDPHNQKDTLIAYTVTAPGGIYVAEGNATMNLQYGKGGGKQYFVPHANDFKGAEGSLKQIELSDALDIQSSATTQRQHSKRDAEFLKRIVVAPKSHSETIASASQNELREYVLRNGLATYVDFGALPKQVSQILVRAICDAKQEFPFVQMSFVGSMQSRNKFAEDKLRKRYTEAYQRANPSASLEQLRPYIEKRVKKDMRDFSFEASDIAMSYYFDKPESFGDGARKLAIGISVNEDLVSNYEKAKAMCEKMVRDGVWPLGCATIKSVIDHEIAHQISDRIGAYNDPYIKAEFDKFRSQNGEQDAELLSKYARTDIHEFIAEAWAEYKNNPNPRPIALAVGKRLKELAKNAFADSELVQERML